MEKNIALILIEQWIIPIFYVIQRENILEFVKSVEILCFTD